MWRLKCWFPNGLSQHLEMWQLKCWLPNSSRDRCLSRPERALEEFKFPRGWAHLSRLNLRRLPIVAIFYPFSQFCEIDISLLSLQKQPNTAPNLFQRGGEYGKYVARFFPGRPGDLPGPLDSLPNLLFIWGSSYDSTNYDFRKRKP